MTQGQLPVDWHGQQAVVGMPDEVDMANGAAIQEGLLAALAQRPAVLVVDMTRTTFCDSAGVRAIMLTHRQAAAAGCQLRLVIGSLAVTRVFTIIGAGQLVPIHPDLAGALAAAPVPPEDGSSAQTGS
jgi:anti-sigma B factor antagonist